VGKHEGVIVYICKRSDNKKRSKKEKAHPRIELMKVCQRQTEVIENYYYKKAFYKKNNI